jgi:hypothetical protein
MGGHLIRPFLIGVRTLRITFAITAWPYELQTSIDRIIRLIERCAVR